MENHRYTSDDDVTQNIQSAVDDSGTAAGGDRRAYFREYNRDRRVAQNPFRSLPTPPEVLEQLEQEFRAPPAGTKPSTFRTQKTRRKLQLKKQYCHNMVTSNRQQGKQS